MVQNCLAQKMEEYENEGATAVGTGGGMFGCFNADKAVRQAAGNEGGYATGAGVKSGSVGWKMGMLLGVGVVVGTVMGGL
jgi:general stress protein YciG